MNEGKFQGYIEGSSGWAFELKKKNTIIVFRVLSWNFVVTVTGTILISVKVVPELSYFRTHVTNIGSQIFNSYWKKLSCPPIRAKTLLLLSKTWLKCLAGVKLPAFHRFSSATEQVIPNTAPRTL